MKRSFALIAFLLMAGCGTGVLAATSCAKEVDQLPGSIKLDLVAKGLSLPVHLSGAGDGSGRLYVVEQDGVVRIIDAGRLLPEPFLDIEDRVRGGGEKGLLSLVFHREFAKNRTFFVNYTSSEGGLHTRISRFQASTALAASPASEKVLLKIDQPYGNHNGGQIAFGPDGMLYVGMGDGGSANDPKGNGQKLETLLGAMLRIDVSEAANDRPYSVPPSNPFVAAGAARPEIWAYGLRNPWRFSFDRGTGALWLADVGQNRREEVNVVRKGGNYGWNVVEGDICTPAVNRTCDKDRFDAPVWTYGHDEGQSVTGGFVYRGAKIPALCGVYVFGDYMSGTIWGLLYRDGAVKAVRKLAELDGGLSAFGEDDDLELYVLVHRSGKVMRVGSAAEGAPK